MATKIILHSIELLTDMTVVRIRRGIRAGWRGVAEVDRMVIMEVADELLYGEDNGFDAEAIGDYFDEGNNFDRFARKVMRQINESVF